MPPATSSTWLVWHGGEDAGSRCGSRKALLPGVEAVMAVPWGWGGGREEVLHAAVRRGGVRAARAFPKAESCVCVYIAALCGSLGESASQCAVASGHTLRTIPRGRAPAQVLRARRVADWVANVRPRTGCCHVPASDGAGPAHCVSIWDIFGYRILMAQSRT